MSSSQGAPGQTGYVFTQNAIRDSSDWTSRVRQAIVYKEYSSTPAIVSRPPWMMRGNRFRMTYALGQFKCRSAPCEGDAIENTVVPGRLA
jgi:hypothetical protein